MRHVELVDLVLGEGEVQLTAVLIFGSFPDAIVDQMVKPETCESLVIPTWDESGRWPVGIEHERPFLG